MLTPSSLHSIEPAQLPSEILRESYTKVILCSGHMIDKDARPTERFPAYKEDVVRGQISHQLRDWHVGSSDLGLCGGASGTDILFAELCVAYGAIVVLLLPLPLQKFLETSVRPNGPQWVARLSTLLTNPAVRVAHPPKQLYSRSLATNVYSLNNQRMITTALHIMKNPHRVRAILVWDELLSGDGAGGTADFALGLTQAGIKTVAVINPINL